MWRRRQRTPPRTRRFPRREQQPTQVGAALGTATFTTIGLAFGGSATGTLHSAGFSGAFTAAAVVALATAALGCTIARSRHAR